MHKETHEEAKMDLTHSMAHYLLSIHKLREEKGYARITDIARELNLTKGSVSTGMSNLRKKGLISEEEQSKFVLLTEQGHHEVHQILSTRILLFHFLKDFMGVDLASAQSDACAIEHLLSDATRRQFFAVMKELSCSGGLEKRHSLSGRLQQFNSAINLCDFHSFEQFIRAQKAEYQLI